MYREQGDEDSDARFESGEKERNVEQWKRHGSPKTDELKRENNDLYDERADQFYHIHVSIHNVLIEDYSSHKQNYPIYNRVRFRLFSRMQNLYALSRII
ncbi:hypothetical protein GCM10009000_043530 [Halobacterium noricense]|uniref:Uncharacterized protein n=1 Tax=Haladaptatus pallidirubidus TaxID=1008152 RepID=A0AAV3UF51_9EURY